MPRNSTDFIKFFRKVRGLFICGTDTDIGKTYISRIVADFFSKLGTVTYYKPVQTGCELSSSGEVTAPDVSFVKHDLDIEAYASYCFPDACSPHLAARLAHQPIKQHEIIRDFSALKASNRFLVTEGAGGVMVPLNSKWKMIDLVKECTLPVLLVTHPGLGMINHTMLTVEALRAYKIPIAGVAINNSKNLARDYICIDNEKTIRNALGNIPVGTIEYGADSNSSNVKKFLNALTKHCS